MRFVYTKIAASVCGGMLLALSVPANAAVDAKLLEMLKTNGSISPAQYAELQNDLASDTQEKQKADAQQAKLVDQSTKLDAFSQAVAWAAKTHFEGDVRLRQETVKADGQTNSQDKNRQRVRVRLGAYTEINPEVSTGIRIATGSDNSANTTNQDLNNYFTKKDIWLDLGYIDYHPTAVKNLHLIGGKIKQPWVSEGDIIWDSDINPEGLAATYQYDVNDKFQLFANGGFFTLKDNVDGNGTQFSNDLRMYTGQIGTRFKPLDNLKVTLGGSLYSFDGDHSSPLPGTAGAIAGNALAINGNTINKYRLYEGFGQADISGLMVPLSFYGQLVSNSEASSGQDTAWLFGAKSTVFGFNVDYNYRDVQRNAVVGAFTDSDFANGFTASRGHKLNINHDIGKNFNLGATYFMANSDAAVSGVKDADVNTLQLDAVAKF
ncbi:putative porin [Pseudomonas sp. NA-150]|uniref:putative porin n=1 Tax=Pseudomonas sp. NA-150 TaxID=3367525 RepID=UPI0037C9B6EA